MYHPFYRGYRNSPLEPGMSRQDGTDWNEIGVRVALAGGIYPLILTGGVILALVSYLSCFDGPISSRGLLLPWFAMLVAGFPFLLFSCFLCSTLIAVPLMSIFAWLAKRIKMQIPAACISTVCIGFIAMVWTLLLYCTACWWAAII
jgi:hypothetical protein